jgi:hypothetical protein
VKHLTDEQKTSAALALAEKGHVDLDELTDGGWERVQSAP